MHPKMNKGNYPLWTVCIILIDLCRIQGTITTHNRDVELGGKVTLRCTPSTPYHTLQVTWQKEINGSLVNIAVYHNQSGPNVLSPHNHQINFTVLGVNDTAITFWNASVQDNGCYQCLFNTFPSGPVTAKPCLSVYDHLNTFLHYRTSDRHTNATCFATGFPRPYISWLAPAGKTSENQVTHPNGTVSVISSIYINTSRSHAGQELICKVEHRGRQVDLKLVLTGRGHYYQDHGVLILLALMPTVLLMN